MPASFPIRRLIKPNKSFLIALIVSTVSHAAVECKWQALIWICGIKGSSRRWCHCEHILFRLWTRSKKSQHSQNKATSWTEVNNFDVVTIELNSVVDDFSIRTDGGIKTAQIIKNKRTVSFVIVPKHSSQTHSVESEILTKKRFSFNYTMHPWETKSAIDIYSLCLDASTETMMKWIHTQCAPRSKAMPNERQDSRAITEWIFRWDSDVWNLRVGWKTTFDVFVRCFVWKRLAQFAVVDSVQPAKDERLSEEKAKRNVNLESSPMLSR